MWSHPYISQLFTIRCLLSDIPGVVPVLLYYFYFQWNVLEEHTEMVPAVRNVTLVSIQLEKMWYNALHVQMDILRSRKGPLLSPCASVIIKIFCSSFRGGNICRVSSLYILLKLLISITIKIMARCTEPTPLAFDNLFSSNSMKFLLYPPQTLFVVGILFSRCLCVRVCVSVRASVCNVLFP